MASRNASYYDGGFAGALLAPLRLVFALTLAFTGILVVAWIVDWIFVFKVWPDGIERLKTILAADLARAQDLAAGQGGVPDAMTGAANLLYALVFRFTGIHDMGMRFTEGTALSIPDTIVRNTYVANHAAIEVAMIATQLLGIRLAELVRLAPIFTLIYVVAGADGLTQRAIRRDSGGRESASLYHRAKYLQVTLISADLLIGLFWPGPLDVRRIGLPLAAAVGLLARLQWAYYKKHP